MIGKILCINKIRQLLRLHACDVSQDYGCHCAGFWSSTEPGYLNL
jgi:hypothetical protein